jgi:hypothetical protein
MELGAYGYLIAGIWGSYGELVVTYFYFAILYAAARLLARDAMPFAEPMMRRPRSAGRGMLVRAEVPR